MHINTKHAVKKFYPTSSFDLIYSEAVANSLDADATLIDIAIKAENYASLTGLTIVIRDNGGGFTPQRFAKFSTLLEVDEKTHKGVGRLVYLNYFSKVNVVSVFDQNKERRFVFSETFEGKSEIRNVENQQSYTQLTMTDFIGEKIHNRAYLLPNEICRKLLEVFYMRLYLSKRRKQNITIAVSLDIEQEHREEKITTDDIPSFSVKELEYKRELFANSTIYYYIHKVDSPQEVKLITALSVDDRTNNIDVIAKDNIPPLYDMVFLLVSDSFMGKVDDSRQNLALTEYELQEVKKDFRKGILEILSEQIPSFAKKKKEEAMYLNTYYPHLLGYFSDEDICMSSRNDIVKKAQERFFSDQRDILGYSDLSDNQYEKALDMSARVLAEYILFRQRTIERLKGLTPINHESEIHDILAPKRKKFNEENFIEDIYRNNVWVLDDKFMTYRTILSEAEMTEVIGILTQGEVSKNADRPDITLFFSANPNDTQTKFDMVIVELKRLGIGAERNSDVTVQLHERARALSLYYQNRIQRIWYYGVVELDAQTRLDLRTYQFAPLFSKGKVYYKSSDVFVCEEPEVKVHADMYIMDYKALISDAEDRNSTFMKILKYQIGESLKIK